MRSVVIFGVGEVAEVIHYYLTREGGRTIAAFCVDAAYITSDTHFGVPVVPFETVQTVYPPADYDMYIAASFRNVNKLRESKVQDAEAKGYSLTSHISPHAVVWDGFVLNRNTFIMENNVIQPFVTIGKNVILWSGNHIGHHSAIQDHCFIASHVVVSGSVTVGRGTFIGVNATLRDNITIGSHNVIGAGALVLKDTVDEAVLIGSRATLLPKKSSELQSI